MSWRSFQIDGRTNTRKTGSIPREQLTVAEKIVPEFFAVREESENYVFQVEDMIRWIRANFPEVAAYMSQIPRSQVRAANPDKSILDVQDLCYQLSSPDSFWIEDEETCKRLMLLNRIGKTQYELRTDWNERL